LLKNRLYQIGCQFIPALYISGILLLCTGLAYPRTTAGSSFYIKSEITSESNIFEDSTNTQSFGNQLWFGLSHNYLSKRQSLHLNFVSNLAYYAGHRAESKAVNLLTVQYNYNIAEALSFQAAAEVFNKQWYQTSSGYTSSLVSSGIEYYAGKIKIKLGGEYLYNNFPSYSYFTSDYNGLFLHIGCFYPDKIYNSIKISRHTVRYSDRLIVLTESPDSAGLPFQKDKMLTLQAGTEIRRRNIFGAYIRYTVNTSNSRTASFQAAACRLLASRKVMGIYTQLIIQFQIKKYSEDVDKFIIFSNPDPEQNIQNQLLLGWDKPLNSHFSIQGKLAYIKNETVYSNKYYDKWFISIGILYRMP